MTTSITNMSDEQKPKRKRRTKAEMAAARAAEEAAKLQKLREENGGYIEEDGPQYDLDEDGSELQGKSEPVTPEPVKKTKIPEVVKREIYNNYNLPDITLPVQISYEILERALYICQKEGFTVSALITRLIREYKK